MKNTNSNTSLKSNESVIHFKVSTKGIVIVIGWVLLALGIFALILGLTIFLSIFMGYFIVSEEKYEFVLFSASHMNNIFLDVTSALGIISSIPCTVNFICDELFKNISNVKFQEGQFLNFAEHVNHMHFHHLRLIGRDGVELIRVDFNHSNFAFVSDVKYNMSHKEYHLDFLKNASTNEVYFSKWSTHGPTTENEEERYEYLGNDLDGDHHLPHDETFPLPSLVKAQKSVLCNGFPSAYVIANIRMSSFLHILDDVRDLGNMFIIDGDGEYLFNNNHRDYEFQEITGREKSFNRDYGINLFNNLNDDIFSSMSNTYMQYFECQKLIPEFSYFMCMSFTYLDAIGSYPLPIIIGLFADVLLILLSTVFVTLRFWNKRLKRSEKEVEKFAELDDIDILIEENKAERETTFDLMSHLQLHRIFFSIVYKDIKILRKVGSSLMASVFLGRYGGQLIALKTFKLFTVINQDRLLNFQREVDILKRIKHPNTLSYIGSTFSSSGRIGSVTEWCVNGNLRSYMVSHLLKNKSAFAMVDRIRILKEIVLGMMYIHNMDILHRDLKPDNCFLNEKNKVKLGDFGLSRAINEFCGTKTSNLGTSYYMAPEIVLGKRYGKKIDVFSFGIMCYEVLFEEFEPFNEINSEMDNFGIEFRVANNPEFRPNIDENKNPEIPSHFYGLIRRCWDDRVGKRPSFKDILGYMVLEMPKVDYDNENVMIQSLDSDGTDEESLGI